MTEMLNLITLGTRKLDWDVNSLWNFFYELISENDKVIKIITRRMIILGIKNAIKGSQYQI